jgi:hypothetical protein
MICLDHYLVQAREHSCTLTQRKSAIQHISCNAWLAHSFSVMLHRCCVDGRALSMPDHNVFIIERDVFSAKMNFHR